MLSVVDLSLMFGGTKLFSDVNIKFTPGNCYGIIGANGAGKSTFLRVISGELEPTTGNVIIPPKERMTVLKQNHYEFDEFSVLDTVIMGNPRMHQIIKEKEVLYAKEDFTDADGVVASQLEEEFAEMDGWEAETDAERILQGLGVSSDLLYSQMSELKGGQKVKVLLAQALFGKPDIILLDEPTNHLDISSIDWLEDFLLDFMGTVIVVSHDRHFLNTVCTHIADVDFGKIRVYTGNYDFWYESSRMMQQLLKDQNKKQEDKIKELQNFIERFSANKSKSKQATSRKKLIEKLTVDDLPSSSRRYPFVGFKPDRECGKEILTIEGLSKDGLLNDINIRLNKGDKIALVGDNEQAQTAFLKILAGEMEPDAGEYKWGVSTSQTYFPKDNSEFFESSNINLVQWLSQYSQDDSEIYLRGFLGRMLFSGEDVYKQVKVLSGGERVRCMLSRMMLSGANVLILDQPTNHLDLESITAVNNGLTEYNGNLIFSSQDHQFIQTIANRIIEILPDGTIFDRAMTYDEFLDYKRKL